MDKLEIPKQYQQLCKDIANVIRKFELDNINPDDIYKEDGIYSFTGKFKPKGMGRDWGEIQFHWESWQTLRKCW